MTRIEIEKFIQRSAAFQGMEKKIQKTILKADGVLFDRYVKIFQDEFAAQRNAMEVFVRKSQGILENFQEKAVKIHKDALVQEEKLENENNKLEAKRMLHLLNNL